MVLTLIFIAALLQSEASASDLAPAFGNTLVSTYPDGRTARTWLSADGRYEGQGRRGGASSGVWRVRDGRICLTQRRPIPFPRAFCTPIVKGEVGTRWTARAVTGETVQMELRAGR
jgi:hypothetical protein